MEHFFIEHPDGSVSMDAKRWGDIKRDLAFLDALEWAGVDNWNGYDEALEILNKNEYSR